MQAREKSLEIINSILEDVGIVRYCAVKNRMKNEPADSPTLLCFYRSAEPADTEGTAIGAYRTNLQKLRRKIEERRIKITETENFGRKVQELSETQTVKNEEVLLTVSPNGTASVLCLPEPAPIKTLAIKDVGNLEDFRHASVSGECTVMASKQPHRARLEMEGTVLTTTITDRKKKEQTTIISTDISQAKIFLVAKQKKSFFTCGDSPPKYISLQKEIEIVNVITGSTTEIILKNISTGAIMRETTRRLEFSIQDAHNSVLYRVDSAEELIRWILLVKTRMFTVDRWSQDELLKSIRR